LIELRAAGAEFKAYDPLPTGRSYGNIIFFDKVTYCKDAYEALVDA